jgi:hypothetical protein
VRYAQANRATVQPDTEPVEDASDSKLYYLV